MRPSNPLHPARRQLVSLLILTFATVGTSSASNDPVAAGAPDDVVTLDPLLVTSGSSSGYRAEATYTADGVLRNYLDVPQTIDVVTTQFMNDFGLFDSRSSLETVPGVQIGPIINGAVYNIRGIETNALYVDGLGAQMQTTTSFSGQFVMPTVFYDRIEVVKGPTSAEFALGEAGGAINYVSKTPQGINRTDVQLSVGTYDNYRASLDQQGVNGQLSYRLILDREAGNSELQYAHTEITGGQFALRYQPTATTTIDWITSDENSSTPAYNPFTMFHDQTAAEFRGFVAIPGYTYNPASVMPPAALPDGFVPNSDNGLVNGWSSNQHQFFRSYADLVQKFGDHISLRDAVQIDTDVEATHLPGWSAALVANQPASGEFGLRPSLANTSFHSHAVRNAFTARGDFAFLGGQWTTLAGGDIGEGWSSDLPGAASAALTTPSGTPFYVNYATGAMVNVNSLNPTFSVIDDSAEELKSYSFFAQEEVTYFSGRLSVLGGWRKDFLNDTDTSYSTPSSSYGTGWEHTSGSPRVAVTFKPLNWLSVYSLYSVHNEPTQITGLYGAVAEVPLSVLPNKFGTQSYTPRGTDVEEGVKASLLDGKLTATATYFHETTSGTTLLISENVSYIDLNGVPQTTIPVNEVVGENIHGFELSLTGQVEKRLEVSASYSSDRGTVPATVSGTTASGSRSVAVTNPIHPPDTIDVYAKLDLGTTIGTGFYVTAGSTCYGPYPYGSPLLDYAGVIHRLEYPGWQYLATAGVGYRWMQGKQSLNLTCRNLTDTYVDILPINFRNPAVDTGRQTTLTYNLEF